MSKSRKFEGFTSKTEFTAIPNPFFSSLLPQIDDLAELKITLYIFWALYRKKGFPRFISYTQLQSDESLMSGLANDGSAEDQLATGLELAVKRGTLLRLELEKNEETSVLFFLNNEPDRLAVEQIQNGEILLEGIAKTEPALPIEKLNIFTLYEQHIGLLTPIIAEELKEAEDVYPASWIEDAFREAVSLNKRSWRYISRILERWDSQGKDDGRTGTDSQKDISPEEYLNKYGRLTRK